MPEQFETSAVVWNVMEFDDERDEVSAYLRLEGSLDVGEEEPAVTEMISVCWVEPKQGRKIQDSIHVTLSPSDVGVMLRNGPSALQK